MLLLGGLGCMGEIHFADVGIDNVVLSVAVHYTIELNQCAEVPTIAYVSTALAVRCEIDLGCGTVKV